MPYPPIEFESVLRIWRDYQTSEREQKIKQLQKMGEGSVELEAIVKEAVDLENIPIEEVFDNLKCTKEGLSSEQVQQRLDLFGYNKLEEKKESKILKFLGFMWNPLSWVMEAAAIMAIGMAHGGVNLHNSLRHWL
eukprot:XP_025983810.1 ATPase 7, plasma membrane-type-like [Glycine max]